MRCVDAVSIDARHDARYAVRAALASTPIVTGVEGLLD